jgi:hypothetical protein
MPTDRGSPVSGRLAAPTTYPAGPAPGAPATPAARRARSRRFKLGCAALHVAAYVAADIGQNAREVVYNKTKLPACNILTEKSSPFEFLFFFYIKGVLLAWISYAPANSFVCARLKHFSLSI